MNTGMKGPLSEDIQSYPQHPCPVTQQGTIHLKEQPNDQPTISFRSAQRYNSSKWHFFYSMPFHKKSLRSLSMT